MEGVLSQLYAWWEWLRPSEPPRPTDLDADDWVDLGDGDPLEAWDDKKFREFVKGRKVEVLLWEMERYQGIAERALKEVAEHLVKLNLAGCRSFDLSKGLGSHLTHLYLRKLAVSDDALRVLPPRLILLDLTDAEINSSGVGLVPKSLRTLWLTRTLIEGAEIPSFPGTLSRLALNGCQQLGDVPWDKLPLTITDLDLRGLVIWETAGDNLQRLPNLQWLRISAGTFQTWGWLSETVQYLGLEGGNLDLDTCPRTVERVDPGNVELALLTRIRDEGLAFKWGPEIDSSKLTEWFVSNLPDEFRELRLVSCPKIKDPDGLQLPADLRIYEPPRAVSNWGLRKLSPSLEELYLNGCRKVTEDCLGKLSTTVTVLDMRNVGQLTDRAAWPVGLRKLLLSETDLTSAGVQRLSKDLRCLHLEGGANIDAAAIRQLPPVAELRLVNLPSISDPGISAIPCTVTCLVVVECPVTGTTFSQLPPKLERFAVRVDQLDQGAFKQVPRTLKRLELDVNKELPPNAFDSLPDGLTLDMRRCGWWTSAHTAAASNVTVLEPAT